MEKMQSYQLTFIPSSMGKIFKNLKYREIFNIVNKPNMIPTASAVSELIENFITETINEELKDSETKTSDEVVGKFLRLWGIATKLQGWCNKFFVRFL